VPGTRNLDKGNKRKVRQIRWKRSEIVSAILFAIAMTILAICVAWWLARHRFD
jgi:4-hydroxybenzoate polyprenyltransferase